MAARIDLTHKLHVLTKKEELDSVRVPGKVVIVLDILFATTTMVTALAHGTHDTGANQFLSKFSKYRLGVGPRWP